MKKSKSIIVLALICLFIPASLFAQNPTEPPKKEESIEELYLSNPSLRIAYEASRAEDRESKLLAISQINELMEKGVGSKDEEEITKILRDLASQGTTVVVREKGRLINYYSDVRREACRALANVKSEDAKKRAVKALIDVLKNDDDPIVKSNAAYSLGIIGSNENEGSAHAIAVTLEIQDYMAPNDNFAYAGVLAFERIAKANNGIFDAAVLRVVVKISQGNYNRSVKTKAYEVLQLLRSYSK